MKEYIIATEINSPRLAWEDASSQSSEASRSLIDYPVQVKSQRPQTSRVKQKSKAMERPISQNGERFAGNSPRNDGADVWNTSEKCNLVRSHDDFRLKDPKRFYLTTNQRDFDGQGGLPAHNARPNSSKLYPTEAKFVKSSYQNDFTGLQGKSWTPQRYGSASGNRSNKPHPHHTFMVWKFADRLPPLCPTDEISQEAMNHIAKQSFRSTYQSDFHGMPHDLQISDSLRILIPTVDADKAPYTLDSTTRYQYQRPERHDNLKNNTSRYGCNLMKKVPSVGAVPCVPTNAPVIKGNNRTKYEDEYIDKSEDAKISQHLRPMVAKRLNRYLSNRARTGNCQRFILYSKELLAMMSL
eukprot:Seg1303.10 transcript_id=Seg1303.10/GoldUCD/mRNA.D3Y31 product="Testis-expressed protein 26" protein_id=Seg1303.10/GoldUCD/D3Y31